MVKRHCVFSVHDQTYIYMQHFENYHLEGNKKFDEINVVAQRRELFHDPNIQQQLDNFWRLSTFGDNIAAKNTISKNCYVAVHMKISKVCVRPIKVNLHERALLYSPTKQIHPCIC